MSNESYFSQYDSPNIVIVPNMSCNPSSPKRRKIGNNILVPIVNNATYEKQKLKFAQEIKKHDYSNVDKKIEESGCSSQSPSCKPSWASNYMQSIGVDKKSSIWNCKIPRKKTSRKCIVSIEPTQITPNSTCVSTTDVEKSNQKLKMPQKLETNSNTVKDLTKNKNFVEAKKRSIPDKSNKSKESQHESTTSVSVKNPSSLKNKNKSLNILTSKNKNIVSTSNKIKTNNIKNNKLHEQPINLYTSGKTSLHTISECVNNTKAQKDLNTNLSSTHTSIRLKQKSQNKVQKTNIKSVVIPNHNKGNEHCNVKSQYNETNNDSAKVIASHSTTYYKKNPKDQKCSMENVTSKKNDKTTKKYNIVDLKKTSGLKKEQHNTELKSKVISSNAEICEKTKTKEKLPKTKSNLTANKKTSIEGKIAKTKSCRKIKLVINLICNNKMNPIQCNESSSNESNSGSRNSQNTSNVDLEFLNDFNIDEIVESLNTCENKTGHHGQCDRESNNSESNKNIDKKSINSNIHTGYNSNIEAIELIKTLKGEEDDDLMRIGIENAEELLRNNVNENRNSDVFGNVSKSSQGKILKDHTAMLIKMNEKSDIEIEGKRQILKTKTEETKHSNIQYLTESVTQGTVTIESDNKKNKTDQKVKEEQNINPIVRDLNYSISSKDTDSYKELKVPEDKPQNIGKENYAYNIHKNKTTNLSNSPIDRNGAENLLRENKATSSFNHKPQKNIMATNDETIGDKKKSNYTDTSNALQIEINNKGINHFISEREENNCNYNNNKFVKSIKDVRDSDEQNNNKPTNSTNQELNSVQNDLDINLIRNNKVKEVEIPCVRVQEDKNKDDKEDSSVVVDLKKNKPKDLPDNNSDTMLSQRKLLNANKNTCGNVRSKADLEIILKLEERLYTYSGSKYSIISILHTGKFSKIFKCKHPNGKYYALKMPTPNMKCSLGKEKKQMLYSLISDIPKNNLFIVCLVKAFNMGENWCFLMEYYPKNLDQALSEAGKPFFIEHVQDFARQLAMAVMVLRNKKMIHLDIKPKHILINSSNNMLKVCGFDSLCYINQKKVLPNVGTVNYRAPEVILGYESGFEIDVWSTGLVLYEMAANKKLFPGTFNNDILYKQICTLGCVPYDMIKKSQFSGVHFVGSKFMRKYGFKGQNVSIVTKFNKNNKLCDSIYNAYFENWSHHRNISQQNSDIGKLSLLVKLLQKMLTMNPKYRLPIEFVYSNPFIFNAHSYQEW